jgi:hypothetical protein
MTSRAGAMAPAGKISMTNRPPLIFFTTSGRTLAISLYRGCPVGQLVAILHLNVLAWAWTFLVPAKTVPAPNVTAAAVFKKSRLVFFIALSSFLLRRF